MEEFWRLTGVRPYLVILPNGTTASTGRLTEMAEQVYDESFSDEGHFVLVFCDNGSGGYNCGYSVGSAARSVMDDEACRILAKELDRAYGDRALSEEQIVSQAFERMEAKADEMLDRSNAMEELNAEPEDSVASLEAKYAAAGASAAVDDELAAMKKEMGLD